MSTKLTPTQEKIANIIAIMLLILFMFAIGTAITGLIRVFLFLIMSL